MSGSTYPTLFLTIPLFNILIDHVEDMIDNNENDDDVEVDNEEKEIIKNAAKNCREKLIKYYNKTNDTYLIAIILDPRLKMEYFKEHEWGEELINETKQKLV